MKGVEEEVEMAGSGNNGRSAVEKEKTKMRERQRRSITTKIFHGLRKHGGFRLSPRADINEVLRELAREAGWIVDPDGTTYRAPSSGATGSSLCPLCSAGKGSLTLTPSSSVVITGGGSDCSTAASPHGVAAAGDTVVGFGGPTSLYSFGTTRSGGYGGEEVDNPLAFYMYRRVGGGGQHPSSTAVAAPCGGGPPATVTMAYDQGQLLTYLKEARASNHNTPVGSPHHG